MKHYNIRIIGKVQGVGFRYATREAAKSFKISGFARNESDGSVYIEAEGESDQLEEFINWCEIGPSWARVVKVDKQQEPLTNYTGFNVR